MSEEYQKQIKFFQTKVQNVDEIVLEVQKHLEDLFGKKCFVPQNRYNAVSFIVEDRIDMQLNLCFIQFVDKDNKLALLRLREIEINPEFREKGYCTSILNFLECTALAHNYDGVDIETVLTEEMYKLIDKLNYKKYTNWSESGVDSFVGNYHKLFLQNNII